MADLPDEDSILDLWPTKFMRRKLEDFEARNKELAKLIRDLERENKKLTTDYLTMRAFLYWPWLIVEIIKANIDVARVILRRKMPINPSLIEVKSTQETELGQVVYANSITLTPGTVTVAIDKDIMTVHALTGGAAEGLQRGEMDRRVTALEAHRAADERPLMMEESD